GPTARRGRALDSMVCQGCIVSGAMVQRSILAPGVRVNSYAQVEDSIVLDDVDIGRYVKIRSCIIDKGVQIPPETEIGYDLQEDARRGFTITESGVVVIPKSEDVERFLTSSSESRRA
ncbi:MAG: glucose-1-phosphate adenylyltransferase, partial [Pirellulales bacterium]